jgi:hypothetical protein
MQFLASLPRPPLLRLTLVKAAGKRVKRPPIAGTALPLSPTDFGKLIADETEK